MTRFRFGTNCWDFVVLFSICSVYFCNVTQGLRKYYWLGPFFKRRFARSFCFNTWQQFSRINRELCYTLCIIEHDTVQTFVLWSQTNRIMGSTRSRVGYREFQWKTGSLYFYWTYIRSSRTLSPRCLFPLRRVMAIKIIECLYTRAYAQLSRNFTSPFFSRSPSSLLFLLTYRANRIFLESFINAWTKYRTHSLVDPFPIEIFIFVYRARRWCDSKFPIPRRICDIPRIFMHSNP